MKAIKDTLAIEQSLAPAARTATANGSAVSLANVQGNMVVFSPGTITDGTHTPSVETSDDGSTGWAAAPAADLVGTLANLASNTPQKVSYIGAKAYIRPKVTVAGATTGGVYGASAILSGKRKQPA